ncbi:restriction endonuclease subunit S [Streptococcus sp. sy018]|nr:restriction endonuclease subunit S [Streptococcus sp. sy018]
MKAGGEWKEVALEKLFRASNGDFDIKKEHLSEIGHYVVTAGETNAGVAGKTTVTAKVFSQNTITIDMFGTPFYRNFEYKMVTHARVFSLKAKEEFSKEVMMYLSVSLQFLKKMFGYENMCSWIKIKELNIKLPYIHTKIAKGYMESYIKTLEAERIETLEAYLTVTGLKDYHLTEKDKETLDKFAKLTDTQSRVE